jgi:hypothetical protein
MPLAYVKPEEAFEVTQPSSGGRPLNLTVYHVYKGTNFPDPLVYWYTFDEAEGEDNEFDIRELPTFSLKSLSHQDLLQGCLKRGMVRIENNKLVILVGGE